MELPINCALPVKVAALCAKRSVLRAVSVLSSSQKARMGKGTFSMKSARITFLAGASALALTCVAQQAAAQSDSNSNVEQVEVTGTHIVRDGYEAPTPVT